MPALTHGRAAKDYRKNPGSKGKNGPVTKYNASIPNRIKRTKFFGISHGKYASISTTGSRNRFTRAAINRRICCGLNPTAGTNTPVGGARVDGYIANSTGQVIDLSTGTVILTFKTDAQGKYSINIPDIPPLIKINFLADGTDVSTGKAVTRSSSSVVSAPPLGEPMPEVVASPLTTMVSKLVEKSIGSGTGNKINIDAIDIKQIKTQAKAKTAKIFNINPADLEKDFIKEGNSDIAKAAISVATCISTLASSAKKGGVEVNDDDMFGAFMNTIATKDLNELGGDSGFKLTDSSSMGDIVKNAASDKGVTLSDTVISNIGSSVSNAATSIQNAEGNDFEDIMKDMTRRKEKSKAAIEEIDDITATNFSPPAAVKKLEDMNQNEKDALAAIKVGSIIPVEITNPPVALNETLDIQEGGSVTFRLKLKPNTGSNNDNIDNFDFYLLVPPHEGGITTDNSNNQLTNNTLLLKHENDDGDGWNDNDNKQSEELTLTLGNDNNFFGVESLLFNIWDEDLGIFSDVGEITFNVTNVNDKPVSGDDFSKSGVTDSTINIQLLGSDVDENYGSNEQLTFILTKLPTKLDDNGDDVSNWQNDNSAITLMGNLNNALALNSELENEIVYRTGSETGTFHFKYKTVDKDGAVSDNETTVTLTITQKQEGVNDANDGGHSGGGSNEGGDQSEGGHADGGGHAGGGEGEGNADGGDDNSNDVIEYQWQRRNDENSEWVDIANATNQTYSLLDIDNGKQLRVKVTKNDDIKYSSETKSINSPTYKWQRRNQADDDWEDIAGATSQTYTLENADAGRRIRVNITNSSNETKSSVTQQNVKTQS